MLCWTSCRVIHNAAVRTVLLSGFILLLCWSEANILTDLYTMLSSLWRFAWLWCFTFYPVASVWEVAYIIFSPYINGVQPNDITTRHKKSKWGRQNNNYISLRVFILISTLNHGWTGKVLVVQGQSSRSLSVEYWVKSSCLLIQTTR